MYIELVTLPSSYICTIVQIYELGYEDYFFGEGVCLIEWSKLISELIPDNASTVLIEKNLEKGLDYRKITVE